MRSLHIGEISRQHFAELRDEHHGLTRMQWVCAKLLAEGSTRREIAAQFGLTKTCIGTHITAAMVEFGVTTDVELAHVMIAVGDVAVVDFRCRGVVAQQRRAARKKGGERDVQDL